MTDRDPGLESALDMLRRSFASLGSELTPPAAALSSDHAHVAIAERAPDAAALAVADALLAAVGDQSRVLRVARATLQVSDDRTLVLSLGESIVVGRSPGDGRVSIPHPELSRSHVKFDFDAGGLYVTDLESTNGTTLRRAADTPLVPMVATRLEVRDDILTGTGVHIITIVELVP